MKGWRIRGTPHSTRFKKNNENYVIGLFNVKQSLMHNLHNLCLGTLTPSGTNPRLAPLILGRRGKIGLRGTTRTNGS